jgi:hypothetical protein
MFCRALEKIMLEATKKHKRHKCLSKNRLCFLCLFGGLDPAATAVQ